jgi:hypothetical protein
VNFHDATARAIRRAARVELLWTARRTKGHQTMAYDHFYGALEAATSAAAELSPGLRRALVAPAHELTQAGSTASIGEAHR